MPNFDMKIKLSGDSWNLCLYLFPHILPPIIFLQLMHVLHNWCLSCLSFFMSYWYLKMAAAKARSKWHDEADRASWSFETVNDLSETSLILKKNSQALAFLFFASIVWTCNCKLLRKLLGESVGLCTIEELLELEQQLERSVNRIRARKVHISEKKPYVYHFLTIWFRKFRTANTARAVICCQSWGNDLSCN